MSLRLGVPLVILALTLSACGTTTGDRGLSGAGIGAATGAVVGAVVGGPVLAASAHRRGRRRFGRRGDDAEPGRSRQAGVGALRGARRPMHVPSP